MRVLPSCPTVWPTSFSCWAICSLAATMSLKASAILPAMPGWLWGRRTEKSPARITCMARSSIASLMEPSPAPLAAVSLPPCLGGVRFFLLAKAPCNRHGLAIAGLEHGSSVTRHARSPEEIGFDMRDDGSALPMAGRPRSTAKRLRKKENASKQVRGFIVPPPWYSAVQFDRNPGLPRRLADAKHKAPSKPTLEGQNGSVASWWHGDRSRFCVAWRGNAAPTAAVTRAYRPPDPPCE